MSAPGISQNGFLEISRFGPKAILIRFCREFTDESHCIQQRLVGMLGANPPQGLIEIVPSFTTILLEFSDAEKPPNSVELKSQLESTALVPQMQTRREPREHRIEVLYDGPDLARLAAGKKLTRDEVIQLHSLPVYKVVCLGFAPGFAYLHGLDTRLHAPRLSAPRARVDAGSVGIGGIHTGIYPFASPGGWNLIGRTREELFRSRFASIQGSEAEAFLLHPGDEVRFIPILP